MGRRRKRRHTADEEEECGCEHGGRCVRGGACACAGAWGGRRCAHYVGHHHACSARCSPPALCVWADDVSPSVPGVPYCVCPEGASCPPTVPPLGAAGGRGAWDAALVTLATLVVAALAVLYLLHRRRRGTFVHARLADNVEITNPMYLAGEDDLDPPPRPHNSGGNHFANPVYESMYAPQQHNPTDEQAGLLAAGEGSPPTAERAALL